MRLAFKETAHKKQPRA